MDTVYGTPVLPDGRLVWQFASDPKAEEGVRIRFLLGVRPHTARDALEMVHNLLARDGSGWLTRQGKSWVFDLAALRLAFSLQLGHFDWLTGKVNVSPEVGSFHEYPNGVTPAERTLVDFVVTRAELQAAAEEEATRPRDWSYWRSAYGDSVYQLSIRLEDRMAGGTAFLIGEYRFATCAHNLVGTVSVYVGEVEVPIENPLKHPTADIAVFSIAGEVELRGRPLPLKVTLPAPAEEVAALGYPAVPLRQPTLNILVGFVESLPTDYRGTGQFIQVSLGTSGGASGGPLIDKCGRVVGIVSERTFEAVPDASIPAKAFPQIVPVSYLGEIDG